jgi:hypothetical protein
MSGSKGIGIQITRGTSGTTATGRDRPIKMRIGSARTTTAHSILPVTGKVFAALSRMTIVGTEAISVTNVASLVQMIATTIIEMNESDGSAYNREHFDVIRVHIEMPS